MALKPFLGGEPAEIKILLHAESGMTTYKLTAARFLSGVMYRYAERKQENEMLSSRRNICMGYLVLRI